MAWERLAHVALSTSGDVIDSGTFTARKNLKIIYYGISSSGINGYMRFNQDSGTNYEIRLSDNGGSDGVYTARDMLAHDVGTATTHQYAVSEILNISDKEKLVIGHVVNAETAGAGNAPTRRELVGKWTNTSAQITRIQIDNGGSGDFAAGSYITVLGAKEAGTADTMSVTGMEEKKHLMIQYKILRPSSGDTNIRLRFNNDTGSNYSYRTSLNGGTDSTGTSQANVELHSGVVNDNFGTIHVINEASKEKLGIAEVVGSNDAGAGNYPFRRESIFKWANTSNAITRVDLVNTSTGDFEEGSEVTVYGTD